MVCAFLLACNTNMCFISMCFTTICIYLIYVLHVLIAIFARGNLLSFAIRCLCKTQYVGYVQYLLFPITVESLLICVYGGKTLAIIIILFPFCEFNYNNTDCASGALCMHGGHQRPI